jgi:hypothetical protein
LRFYQSIGNVIDTLWGTESVDVAVSSDDSSQGVSGLVLGGVDVVVAVFVVSELVLEKEF